MKKISFMLACFISFTLTAQNPFEDGIKSAGTIDYKGDQSESIVYDFKISFPTECSAIYKFTQHWMDNMVDKTNSYELKWYWKDITYIKVDKELNVLELDTDSKIVESSTDKKNNEVVLNDRESDIGIYFKTSEEASKAADWAYNKVISCGGKPSLVK